MIFYFISVSRRLFYWYFAVIDSLSSNIFISSSFSYIESSFFSYKSPGRRSYFFFISIKLFICGSILEMNCFIDWGFDYVSKLRLKFFYFDFWSNFFFIISKGITESVIRMQFPALNFTSILFFVMTDS